MPKARAFSNLRLEFITAAIIIRQVKPVPLVPLANTYNQRATAYTAKEIGISRCPVARWTRI
jgi:hypothetical protein